jgi:transposase-like protein
MEVNCPKCNSKRYVKSGFVREKQRYLCGSCACHYTMNTKGVASSVKRIAVHLYVEGLGFRAISRITGVSDVAIAKWINPMKETLDPMRKNGVRLHELHKVENFFITKEMFNKFGWLVVGMEENEDIIMMGSHVTGTCKLISSR